MIQQWDKYETKVQRQQLNTLTQPGTMIGEEVVNVFLRMVAHQSNAALGRAGVLSLDSHVVEVFKTNRTMKSLMGSKKRTHPRYLKHVITPSPDTHECNAAK